MLRFGLLALLTIASLSTWADCKFQNTPTNLPNGGKETVLIFSEPISSDHWSPGKVDSPLFKQYETWLQSRVSDLSQVSLLKRQRAIYAGIPAPKEVKLFDAILKRELGQLLQPTCIELLLFTKHLENVGAQAYAEFGAFVLENSRTRSLKIYFLSNSQEWLPIPKTLLTEMEADIAVGFELKTLIHNHPFGLGHTDIGGTVIGSPPDFKSFSNYIRTHGLQTARITNGLDTMLYSRRDIDLANALLND